MAPTDYCFTQFKKSINHLALPTRFTYPFAYKTHPIAEVACIELQETLQLLHPTELSIPGRMYGVLVVKNQRGELGYLSAISGKAVTEQTAFCDTYFVPNVFPGLHADQEKFKQQQEVNRLTAQIDSHESNKQFQYLQLLLEAENQAASFQITQLQQQHGKKRKWRKEQRRDLEAAQLNKTLSADSIRLSSIDLARQSVSDKKALAALKIYWKTRIQRCEAHFTRLNTQLEQLKKQRRQLSNKLQKWLFKQYLMLNAKGEAIDVGTLFQETVTPKPPAGSGDCAAPKLLQYAYQHQLTPICMAEFWWGNPPKSEVRKHKQYYPACQGKCLPILTHMLKGLTVDPNPLLTNPAENLPLPIVYQDEHLVVVNKPSGLLSVPGKAISDSVYQRVLNMFPNASGNLILHRLDMATSGLLVLALNHRSHKHLQLQFINKVVKKQYVALLEGIISKKQGEIKLPLTLDFYDRPRQKVCFETGKSAHTNWQCISVENNQSRLLLEPVTGRTHQLRVHCAHTLGLDTPIVGDDLYGKQNSRLMLHAKKLSFLHPISQQRMSFDVEPDF